MAVDIHSRKCLSKGLRVYIDIVAQEGIATVIIATSAYWFIENYPDNAKFLTKSERELIKTRLAADCDAMIKEDFNWAAVREAVSDPSCWLYCLGFHTMSLPLYTLSLFLVSVV
jgi:hypothetical protein